MQKLDFLNALMSEMQGKAIYKFKKINVYWNFSKFQNCCSMIKSLVENLYETHKHFGIFQKLRSLIKHF